MACLILSSPAYWMAPTRGPGELMAFHAVSSSGYSNGHETLPLACGVSPASTINASIFPGSESENGPSAPGGGGGTHAMTAA